MKRFILAALLAATCINANIAITTRALDEHTQNITLTIPVPAGSYVYKEYLNLSVDHPEVTLSEWSADRDATTHFDTAFKDNKKVFDKDFTITVQAKTKADHLDNAKLHVAYFVNSDKKITQEQFPISFNQSAPEVATAIEVDEATVSTTSQAAQLPQAEPASQSFSDRISALVQNTDSLIVRLFLVMLLGLLMSLTPCIYPMIPITAGILQSRGSTSVARNFTVALAYTMGIATTFACLGLLAAFTGQIFGCFLNSPIVIMVIVAILIYLAFSMFGFYDMYIPKPFRGGNQSVQGGSIISAFAFGVVSGSVASPCLSPGLMLLLSIVTTLGSKLLGFLLLFSFGIGLSLPLLLIGTFSTSLNMLPRAGMWMLEVKSFFGFLLLGMSLYFLRPLIPAPFLIWGLAALTAAAGFYYLSSALRMAPSGGRKVKYSLGMLLIAGSVVVGAKGVIARYAQETAHNDIWLHNYQEALALAQQTNKPLFMAFSTPICSLCTAIDSSLFQNKDVQAALEQCCVTVKVDDTTADNGQTLTSRYQVFGFPTYVLINPRTLKEMRRWSSALYDTPAQTFIKELKINASCETPPREPRVSAP